MKFDRGAWWVITHFEGKRKRKRVGTTKEHKRQAEKIAEKINAALVLGTSKPERAESKHVPFDAYAREWLQSHVSLPIERNLAAALSPSTGTLHARHVKMYLVPFFGARSVREIGAVDVQRFYDHCLETGRPPSERSIEMILATLRRIFAQAEAYDVVVKKPSRPGSGVGADGASPRRGYSTLRMSFREQSWTI